MKTVLLSTLIIACLPCAAQPSEPAPAALPQKPTDKAKALEADLAAHPDGEGVKSTLGALYQCYVELGDETRQLATLERIYAVIDKGAGSQIEEIGVILHRMVGLLANSEQVRDVAKARAVIVQAQKDLSNRSEGEKAKRLLAKLEGMLNQPVIGGTMKIAFTALDGTQVDLAAMKGKVVLVDYWATWCAPCVASLPEIKTAYDRYHDKGFEVIGISLDHVKDKAKVETFLEDKKLPWPQSFDGKGWSTPLAASYGISAIPATFLIGKDGRISAIGAHGGELESMLAELLK
jgi:peroxiredoxin